MTKINILYGVLGMAVLCGIVALLVMQSKEVAVVPPSVDLSDTPLLTEEASSTPTGDVIDQVAEESPSISTDESTGQVPRETETGGGNKETLVRYSGNDLTKDIDGDGRADVVYFLTSETGGSGTFYYVAASLATDTGYHDTQAVFVGDRIRPLGIESGPGTQVIVNFVDRVPGEPMTTSPSVRKSLSLMLDPGTRQFGEVVVDFEGEADPKVMTLGMKTWVWYPAPFDDGREIFLTQENNFTLRFVPDGTVAITTDCNSAGGNYIVDGNRLTFSALRATKMYCEGSRETEFFDQLQSVQSFYFTGKGELILTLSQDGGTMTFK